MFILFCLFDLNCMFLFLYMVFLRNKNGLWLLKRTPICQGGEEAFGLIERSSSFSVKIQLVSDLHCLPPADRAVLAQCPLYGGVSFH